MDPKYVCPCGLNCSDCLFYRNDVYEAAANLKQAMQDSQFGVFMKITANPEVNKTMARHLGTDEAEFARYFESFAKIPEFLRVLDGIIALQCKTPCRVSGGVLKKCEAVTCVQEKGYAGCWECKDNAECGKLAFQRRSYGETIDGNFEIALEKGIEAVPSRGKNYYEWQRRMNGKSAPNPR